MNMRNIFRFSILKMVYLTYGIVDVRKYSYVGINASYIIQALLNDSNIILWFYVHRVTSVESSKVRERECVRKWDSDRVASIIISLTSSTMSAMIFNPSQYLISCTHFIHQFPGSPSHSRKNNSTFAIHTFMGA